MSTRSRNFVASLVQVEGGAANAEVAVTHGLNAIPLDAFIFNNFSNAILYKSSTAWTSTTAYVKSDTAGAPFHVLFFV
jgi:hypothetical protein